MSADRSEGPWLELLLARLLHYGTWLASSVIALGLVVALVEGYSGPHDPALPVGMSIVRGGIALFILLPVARVLLMLLVFLRERDYRFSAIAALVLLIILLAVALGRYLPAIMQKAH